MAYSVSLWFDEAAEQQVRELWRDLADVGLRTFADGPIRLHVTLAHGLTLDLTLLRRFYGNAWRLNLSLT